MNIHDSLPATSLRRNVSAATTMTVRDKYLYVTAADDLTITLPPCAQSRGLSFTIYGYAVTATKIITIAHKSDSRNWSNKTITATNQSLTLKSTGKEWVVESNNAWANDAAIKVAKVVVGHAAATGCDFKFASAANTTAQNLDCGALVPAFARILDVTLITTEAWDVTTFVTTVGPTTGTDTYIASASIKAANATISIAAAGAPILAISATARNLWLGATPGANWDTLTTGKTSVMVTYIDTNAMK